jgi:hypothetical protein
MTARPIFQTATLSGEFRHVIGWRIGGKRKASRVAARRVLTLCPIRENILGLQGEHLGHRELVSTLAVQRIFRNAEKPTLNLRQIGWHAGFVSIESS